MSDIRHLSDSDHRPPHELVVMALLVVLLWGLWAGQAFFIPLSLAALLAFLGSPLVRRLRRMKVPELVAIFVAALLLILPLVGVGYALARQVQSLLGDYPAIVAALQRWINNLATTVIGQKLHLTERLTFSALAEQVGNGAGEGMKFLAQGLKVAFTAGSELVLTFLFAIGMLASKKHLYLSASRILARFESIEAANVLEAVTSMIEQFLLTKLVVIAIISLLSFVALQLLGLKYAFLLGIMTGVLTLIPVVGFMVSLVPVVIVAIATEHTMLSTVIILGSMVLVHFVEANVFTPKLVGRTLNLNVLATFVGLYGGGLLWGVWGMLLSVPILGVLRIVFSSTASLEPWAYLLSQREDRQFGQDLMNKAFKAEKVRQLLAKTSQTIGTVTKRRPSPKNTVKSPPPLPKDDDS